MKLVSISDYESQKAYWKTWQSVWEWKDDPEPKEKYVLCCVIWTGQGKTDHFSSIQLFYCAASNSNRVAKLKERRKWGEGKTQQKKQAAEKKGARAVMTKEIIFKEIKIIPKQLKISKLSSGEQKKKAAWKMQKQQAVTQKQSNHLWCRVHIMWI